MTHKKIAELVGVSASTVSKALSGSKEVSDEVRDKIIKIALESDYFEKKTKRKLDYAEGKTITVGIICPEIISIYYSRIITYLKNEIESQGGQIAIYTDDFSKEKHNSIIENIVLRNSVDGIISVSGYDICSKLNVPIVTLSYKPENILYDSVSIDVYAMINNGIKYLKSLGHNEIGFVGEPLTVSKYEHYKKALLENGLEYNEDFVYNINKRFEDIGTVAARKMIEKKAIPTAIMTAYDEIALALIHEFVENGIKVPKDVSVMGINDIPYSSYSQIPLTTMKNCIDEQCTLAVQLLYDKILGKDESIRHIQVNHELIIRNSTAPKATSQKENK